MPTLATRLRNACLGVLLTDRKDDQLTDTEYALLGMVETWAQIQENPGVVAETIDKLREYKLTRQQTYADAGGQPTPAPVPQTAPLGGETVIDTRPPEGLSLGGGAPAGLAPDTSEQQEALPLGAADRGPEPQDADTLIDTTPPSGLPAVGFDPPPDYTQLEAMTIKGAKA